MKDMIPRIYRRQIRARLERFPAVALIGPRQCGKTTLAQQIGGFYFDMETAGSEARLKRTRLACVAIECIVPHDRRRSDLESSPSTPDRFVKMPPM